MPRFRHSYAPAPAPATLPTLVEDVLRPSNFFVGGTLALVWEPAAEETVRWEVFRGRLVDAALTRQERSFRAWNVFLDDPSGRSAEPLLSVKWDSAAGEVHVVRAIHCYAWEGYDAGGNVYLSRETRKWVRELVGTIRLAELASAEELRDELVCRLFQAVVGTSRLPLASVEAPLPAFSLGGLAYCYRPGLSGAGRPMTTYEELADCNREVQLAAAERAKLLEVLLRVTPTDALGGMAGRFFGNADAPTDVLHTLFNEVSLSPYTGLAEQVLALLRAQEEAGRLTAAEVVDFLGRLLRRLARHLSAYDLVTFHHRGANYPDALVLDALLRAYLDQAGRWPELFADRPGGTEDEQRAPRLRRRALRQAWLLRRWYEGLAVPEAPTSQGEALRVLPERYPRVPEEQILQPARRPRRLFAGQPMEAACRGPAAEVLRQAVADLDHPDELHELGTALFLDRPLGAGKAPGEPDATPLLSYEAFSRSLAERRLDYLADKLGLLSSEARAALAGRLHSEADVHGLSLDGIATAARPGVVSLADARQAVADFVLLRTTAPSARALLGLFDFAPLAARTTLDYLVPGQFLLVGSGSGERGAVVTVYDARLRPRLELAYDPAAGYRSRAGVEFPVSGLRAEGLVLSVR
jgi:hypothetical protein